MQKTFNKPILLTISIVLLVAACMAPRNISNSGKVTPKGNFAISYSVSGNIPTQTISALGDYPFLNGTFSRYKGWTFIPSIGLRARIGKNSVNKK
jgi:hypothetical protein